MPELNRRTVNLAGAAVCAGMMGFALFAQHGLGLEPCPLCVLQRVATISLGLVFLLAAVADPGRLGARIMGILILLVASLGATVSARQVWLQNLPADQVPACGPGLDYIMEVFPLGEALAMVFEGSGECAEVMWRFLGLSMPGWVLVCLLGLGLGGLILNWRAPRAASAA
ncbi:MAG: disulfide bond formation protein B [Gammaproteobacteria bacterium]|jgi:disulfide bond formation protein DsbB